MIAVSISEEQVERLRALYKKHFNVTLTEADARDVARRLVTLFCHNTE